MHRLVRSRELGGSKAVRAMAMDFRRKEVDESDTRDLRLTKHKHHRASSIRVRLFRTVAMLS
jgi:hypothetical protein